MEMHQVGAAPMGRTMDDDDRDPFEAALSGNDQDPVEWTSSVELSPTSPLRSITLSPKASGRGSKASGLVPEQLSEGRADTRPFTPPMDNYNHFDSAAEALMEPIGFVQTVPHLMLSPTFWMLFAIFSIGCGCEALLTANLGDMVKALTVLGQEDHRTTVWLYQVLSACSCGGRAFFGAISDIIPWRRGILLAICMGLIMTAGIISSILTRGGEQALVVTVLLTSTAYGGMWTLVLVIIAEHFGTANFGKVYGIVALAPIGSSYVMNYIAASIYNAHIHESEVNTHVVPSCIGEVCFRGTYVMCAMLAFVALILCYPLISRMQIVHFDT